MPPINSFIALMLAVLFGGLIGLERELSGKSAGLRTNILICLGATAFTIISKLIVAGEDGTAARIAAQIVTGIGFLGAGAIIQDRGGVHGLTTAATIWVVAAIGTACGAGFFLLATLTTALTLAVLLLLTRITKHFSKQFAQKHNGNHNNRYPDPDLPV